MPTTTNYGWTTPADTDLVKDGASAIRTLGSSADTTVKNLNPETTLGDIAYRSSTSNVNTRLGIGSAGQVLTVVGGVPAWAATTGGKVLQVVQATTSTAVAVASQTMTDSGLTVTITPSLNTSKILILISQEIQIERASATSMKGAWRLMRGSTEIFNGAGTNFRTFLIAGTVGEAYLAGYYALNYLDSPATTSATTYKTQIRREDTGGTITAQESSATSSIIALEIGA